MKKFAQFTEEKKHKGDDEYMELALKAAELSKSNGDLAVGAVLVWPNLTLSEGDTSFSEQDHTAHAVMNVMRKATGVLERHLKGAVLYTTIEPCIMCAMAANLHGIQEIVFGAYDLKNGFISSKALMDHTMFGISTKGGVLASECMKLVPRDWQDHVVEAV